MAKTNGQNVLLFHHVGKPKEKFWLGLKKNTEGKLQWDNGRNLKKSIFDGVSKDGNCFVYNPDKNNVTALECKVDKHVICQCEC